MKNDGDNCLLSKILSKIHTSFLDPIRISPDPDLRVTCCLNIVGCLSANLDQIGGSRTNATMNLGMGFCCCYKCTIFTDGLIFCSTALTYTLAQSDTHRCAAAPFKFF